jgi:predicted NACHT family NTPase
MLDSSLTSKKQSISFTASEQGLVTATNSLKRLGFASKTQFALSRRLSRSTITKFFQGQPIQLDSFKSICDELKLNWSEIAEVEKSLDWLVMWGATQAAGLVVKPILEEFAKDTGKDFAKDFFKDALKKVIHLPEPNILKEAYGKALKEFLQLMEQELVNANCREEQIREYIQPLKQFVLREDVAATLGRAFELECRSIDTHIPNQAWQELTAPSLPEDFDWELVSKLYIRAIKKIINESEKLQSIHTVQTHTATTEGIRDLVGITPEFDLRKYAEGLLEQYGNVKLDSLDTTGVYYSELKLWKIFIPQNVRKCQEFLPQVYELPREHRLRLRDDEQVDEAEITEAELELYHRAYRSQVNRSILEIVAGNSPLHHVVILGDPGAGKSSLLQYLALIWAQPLRDLAVPPTPLLVELRTYAREKQMGRCHDILTFLHGGNITCRLDQQQLHDKLKAGHAIALFDGIDEVFDPVLREEVVTDIHRFTNDYPQVRVIATSRWLGYKVQKLRDAGFQHFMLQDLEDEQIEDFIQRWHDLTFPIGADKERKRDRLQKAIRESKSIRELAGNPLLLTMMAILNRHQELPRDRPELYNQASRVLLHQWDVETKLLEDPQLKDLRISIDYKDKQGMLRKVAHHMQSSAKGLAGNIISATDLENILTDYLRGIVEKGEPRMVARQMIHQLRTRNFILCYLGADSYAFVHRAFLEYFCAWEFVLQFNGTHTLTVGQLKNEVFAPHWQDESWHEVLRLISGMIDAKFVAEMINYLLDQKIDQSVFLEEERQKKEGLSNLILAANCFEEVRNKQAIDSTLTRLMTRLQQEIEQEYPYQLNSETAIILTALVANIGENNAQVCRWLQGCLNFKSSSYVPESAIQALAQGWKDDPDTLPWLKDRAQHDDIEAVRHAAIQALVQGWKDDPQMFEFLCDRAVSDSFQRKYDFEDNPRQTVLEAIIKNYPDRSEVLDLLFDRSKNDPDEKVRNFAKEQLVIWRSR